MGIDKIIIWAFVGMLLAGISVILLTKWKEERAEINVTTGKMRFVVSVVLVEDRITEMDSSLVVPETNVRRDRWIPVSTTEHRLLFGATTRRRIGMVYQDALVITMANFLGNIRERRAWTERIQLAGYAEIWQIRSDIRGLYSKFKGGKEIEFD